MIETLKIQNFRGFEGEHEIPLQRLTCIVGPNGSGKTSVLQAIKVLADCVDYEPPEFLERAGAVPAVNVRETGFQIGAVGQERGKRCAAELLARRMKDNKPGFFSSAGIEWQYRESELEQAGNRQDTLLLPPHGAGGNAPWRGGKQVAPLAFCRPAALISFDPRQLRRPVAMDRPPPYLREDGYGLAWCLAEMQLSQEDDYQRLLEAIRAIIPGFADFEFQTAAGHEENGKAHRALALVNTRGDVLPATAISNGALTAAAVLVAIHSEDRPRILLLDDVEGELHPSSAFLLGKHLQEAIPATRDLQVICASYSRYLLETASAQNVLISGFDGKGRCKIRRMTDHPDYEEWKDAMSPGDFWRATGEQWIAEEHARYGE